MRRKGSLFKNGKKRLLCGIVNIFITEEIVPYSLTRKSNDLVIPCKYEKKLSIQDFKSARVLQ